MRRVWLVLLVVLCSGGVACADPPDGWPSTFYMPSVSPDAGGGEWLIPAGTSVPWSDSWGGYVLEQNDGAGHASNFAFYPDVTAWASFYNYSDGEPTWGIEFDTGWNGGEWLGWGSYEGQQLSGGGFSPPSVPEPSSFLLALPMWLSCVTLRSRRSRRSSRAI